jgi:hypothetical protein
MYFSDPNIIAGLAIFDRANQRQFVKVAILKAIYDRFGQMDQKKTVEINYPAIPIQSPGKNKSKSIRVLLAHSVIISTLSSFSSIEKRQFITIAILNAIDEYRDHVKEIYEYLSSIDQKNLFPKIVQRPVYKSIQADNSAATSKIENTTAHVIIKVPQEINCPVIEEIPSSVLIENQEPVDDRKPGQPGMAELYLSFVGDLISK